MSVINVIHRIQPIIYIELVSVKNKYGSSNSNLIVQIRIRIMQRINGRSVSLCWQHKIKLSQDWLLTDSVTLTISRLCPSLIRTRFLLSGKSSPKSNYIFANSCLKFYIRNVGIIDMITFFSKKEDRNPFSAGLVLEVLSCLTAAGPVRTAGAGHKAINRRKTAVELFIVVVVCVWLILCRPLTVSWWVERRLGVTFSDKGKHHSRYIQILLLLSDCNISLFKHI